MGNKEIKLAKAKECAEELLKLESARNVATELNQLIDEYGLDLVVAASGLTFRTISNYTHSGNIGAKRLDRTIAVLESL